jgi:hypothetical protein
MTRNNYHFRSRARWFVLGLYAGLGYLFYGVVTHELGVGGWNLWLW